MNARINRYIKLVLASLFVMLYTACSAQTVEGLWQVSQVNVGENQMTPIAKWFQFNADGSYSSGNGWLKNSEGNYTFNVENNTLEPKETSGIEDTAGPFTISFPAKGKMQWQRQEEGMLVTISLEAISQLPKAPSDKLVGLWDLTKATQEGKSILAEVDAESSYYIFIRWDRLYMENDRKMGYWHINAHRPEVTFMPHQQGAEPQSWRIVRVEDTELVLEGISDSNSGEVRSYKRLSQFPQ